MTPKFHSLKVQEVRRETEDSVSVVFEIPNELLKDYSYVSGQYLTLKATSNGEEFRRSYSLCSAPHEKEWRVAIKQVENGKFSTYANTKLRAGDTMEVMTPTGSFCLNPADGSSRSFALFASGSGITPILSIAKSVLNGEPQSDIILFYGNKGSESVIFRDDLNTLKNQYNDRLRIIHIYSRENLNHPILNGRIDEQKAGELYDSYLANKQPDQVFICGPEAMILGVKDSLIRKGIDEKNIHFELFTAPGNAAPSVESSVGPIIKSAVTVILDDDEYELNLASNGKSILDAAQEVGADLPFACKGGVCCTCKAKILEGSAKMDVNYALEPYEVEDGYILTCQAHPTSDKVVISFDE